jgi:hypothetical protein
MKLYECIEDVKEEKPNAFSDEKLTKFINELEAMVQEYLGIEPKNRVEYDFDNDEDRELIVPSPYDSMYKSWLKAKIDYSNEEYYSYANNQAQFESDYEDWQAYAMGSGMVRSDIPQCIKNWW